MSEDEVDTKKIEKEIALRLFLKNPYSNDVFDEDAEIEQIISIKDLYESGDVEVDSILINQMMVKIKYQNDFLSIKTNHDVDVILSGDIPAKAIHIETRGGCALVDGCAKNLSMGLFIKSNYIVLDIPINSTGFVALFTGSKSKNSIEIKKNIEASLFRTQTTNLLVDSIVTIHKAMLRCKLLHNFPKGKILIGSKKNKNDEINADDEVYADDETNNDYDSHPNWYEVTDKHIFIEEHDALRGKLYRLEKSIVISERLINEGNLIANNAAITSFISIKCSPNSKTDINDTTLLSKNISIDKLASVVGENSYIRVDGNLYVDGTCVIEKLAVIASDINVSGVLWGEESLSVVATECTTISEVIGSKQTYIKSNYLLGAPMQANEVILFKSFINGGVVGVNSLVLDTLFTMISGGAYLYGANVSSKSGMYISLLGYIRSYNFSNTTLFLHDWGIKVPCAPQNWGDLLDKNKFLQVSGMVAQNFPVFRGAISAGSLVVSSGTCLFSAAKILYDKPSISYHVNNGRKYASESIQQTQASIMSVATGRWDIVRFKEVVDLLLKSQQIYVSGNRLLSNVTNTIVLAKDVQDNCYNNPDFTFENIKNSAVNNASSVRETLTEPEKFSNAVNCSKNIVNSVVNHGVNVAKGKFEKARSVVTDPFGALHKVSNDHFNSFADTIDSLKSTSLNEAATKVTDTIYGKINMVSSIGAALLNNEPAKDLPSFRKIDGNLLEEAVLESVSILSSGIFETSFVSNTFGTSFAGNVVRYNAFANHYDDVVSMGYSEATLFDWHNHGEIYSFNHSLSARDRYNDGVVHSKNINLSIRDNHENGVFDITNLFNFNIRNFNLNSNSVLSNFAKVNGVVHGDFIGASGFISNGGSLSVEGEYRVLAGVRHFINDTTFKANKFDLHGQFDADETSKINFINTTIYQNAKLNLSNPIYQGENFIFMPGSFANLGGILSVDNIDDQGVNAQVNNLIIQGKFLNRKGNWVYKGLFNEEVENIISSVTSKLVAENIKDPDTYYLLECKDSNRSGHEKHSNSTQVIENMPSAEALDLALSRGKYKDHTITESIVVVTESNDPICFSGSRKDGVYAEVITNGIITLDPRFDRARGVTFSTYLEALQFEAGYATYNLPPPPPCKRSVWRYVVEVCGGLAPAFFRKKTVSGVAVGIVLITAAAIADRRRRHYDKKQSRLREDEALQLANLQNEVNMRVLSVEEKSALAGIYAELCNIKINNTINNVCYLENGSDYNFAQIMDKYFDEFRIIVNNAAAQIAELHNETVNTIKDRYSAQREDIDLSGTKIGVSVGVNAGSTGYDVFASVVGGYPGQTVTATFKIFEHEYSKPSIQKSSPKKSHDSLNDMAPYIGSIIEPSIYTSVRGPERDYCLLNEPSSHNFHAHRQLDELNGYISETQYSDNLEIVSITNNYIEQRKPLIFTDERTRLSNNIISSKASDSNVIAAVKQKEKSAIRKFAELFENDDEDFNTDFYDVRITPDIRYGRDFITKSIVRNTRLCISASLDFNTLRNLSILAWDGVNQFSYDLFGVANKDSLRRVQELDKALNSAWNTFKDIDGISKSYIMLDLVIGFTVSVLVSGGVDAIENAVVKKLAHYTLKPLLRNVNEEIQKINNIRTSFYENHSYSWPKSTKSKFTDGFITPRTASKSIITPLKLLDKNVSTFKNSHLDGALEAGINLFGNSAKNSRPNPMLFTPKDWLVNRYLEQKPLKYIEQPAAIIEEVVEHRYPSSCPYTLKLNLRNPVFREKFGYTDPTVRPHESWSKKDFIPEYILVNPEPALPHEVEIISQWMFERKPIVDKWRRFDLDIISDADTKLFFSKVRNQLINSMQPKDICGILKENRGVKIYKSNGEVYDHRQEWFNARVSLKKCITDFSKKGPYDFYNIIEYKMLYSMISDMSYLWSRYKQLLNKGNKKCLPKLKM